MSNEDVKVSLMAEELGVTAKTIYNWIAVGKLIPSRPGFVNQVDAYEVWLQQKQDRSVFARTMASHGITRGPNGRFCGALGEGE